MGGLERKLLRLEASSEERATAKLKTLFDSLPDRSLVLIFADAKGVELTPQEEQERASAEAELFARGVEGLLELAVRPETCSSPEQVNRRGGEVMKNALFPGGRRARLSRLLYELEAGKR